MTTSFTYDALGRRATKTVNGTATKFLYDGAQLIAETDGAGTLTARYLFGPRLDEPLERKSGSTTSYYAADGLGSVAHLTTSAGAIAETYTYETFGKLTIKNAGGTTLTTSALGNRFTFTGREYDSETGLYYYRARYYSPMSGRFLSRDPLGYLPDANLYRYVGNNPLRWIDPFGLDKIKPWWQKLEEGYYYGAGFGQEATEWYASQHVRTGNWLWAIPGNLAALWTPQTYQATGWALISAALGSRAEGRPYRQYYPEGNPNYQSRWLTRGNYTPGSEAQRALRLPEYNPGTAVREVRPNLFEPVAGPRSVTGGTGTEYFRGWQFPQP